MKMKHIKKIIKNEINDNVPEKLDISSFNLKRTEKPVKMRKLSTQYKFGLSLASFILIFVVVALFALQPKPIISPKQPFVFKGENQVLSFSAMSTASILTHLDATKLTSQQQKTLLSSNSASSVANQIVPYLEMAERFIRANDGFKLTELDSDLEAYMHLTIFETVNLTNSIVTYKMYYNMINVFEEDDETTYDLEGILLYGNKTYQIKGSKRIEDDETTLSFKSVISENHYVESSYKVEEDETKFKFKVVVDGKVVEESTIEIENEDDETEITLEFINGKNKSKYEFNYEEEDGKPKLSITYETLIDGIVTKGEIEVYIMVDPLTKVTKYKLIVSEKDEDDEEEYEVDRDEDDDKDDDEDDDDDEDKDNIDKSISQNICI